MGVPDATVEVFSHQVMLCDNNSFCVLLSRLNQSTDLLDVVRLICKWPPMRKDACWVQMVFMAVMSLLAVAN